MSNSETDWCARGGERDYTRNTRVNSFFYARKLHAIAVHVRGGGSRVAGGNATELC